MFSQLASMRMAETETRMLIAGELVAGEGKPLEVENPYDEQTIATVALPSDDQVDAAIAAAADARCEWAETPAVERGETLHEVAGLGRELGREGLEAFQETKHVHIETEIAPKEWWYPYGEGTGDAAPRGA